MDLTSNTFFTNVGREGCQNTFIERQLNSQQYGPIILTRQVTCFKIKLCPNIKKQFTNVAIR